MNDNMKEYNARSDRSDHSDRIELRHYTDPTPWSLFEQWFNAACEREISNPNAMTLATLDANAMPQARTVLLKLFSSSGFVFYTNSESRKGKALQSHPKAALLLYWKSMDRQVLIEGDVTQMTATETAPYFYSRPIDSQINASVSQQSRPIDSYAELKARVEQKKSDIEAGHVQLELPSHWRGYVLTPVRIEFWQEGDFRLHQRLEFTRSDSAVDAWKRCFLQP